MLIFQWILSPPPSGGRLGGGHSADGVPPSSPPPAGGRYKPATMFLRGLSVKKTSPCKGPPLEGHYEVVAGTHHRHAISTDYDEEASGVVTRRTNLATWSLMARNSPILRSTVCLSFNAVAIRANSSSSCTGLVRKSSAPALMP